MSTLGTILVVLALILSVFSGFAYLTSSKQPRSATRKYAKYGVDGVFYCLSLAELLLLIALISHNYSLQYVYSFSSNATSLIYRITALWAGNAGSLLFWSWFGSLLSFILVRIKREDTKALVPQAMPIMMLTNILFTVLVLIENPFTAATSAYTDGYGLNPMLENFAMIIHPPCLLAGYVLLAVPFALAVSSLIQKRKDSAWINASRSWTLIAWVLLGAGNILGMWWAYVELGWGGYWAWDPVENCGLMPWLLTTALLHSIMIERRRNGFKIWNYVLAILAFNLTIFGAYLSRSDILDSVHSFGDTAMGPAFIAFILINLIVSITLLIKNIKLYKTENPEEKFVSNETAFLFVNILFVFSTFGVWVGTMFPFFSELFTGTRIEQTKDFFQTINVPIYILLCVLAGICVAMGWKKKFDKSLIIKLVIPVVISVVCCIIMACFGGNDWYVLVGGFAFFFMIASTLCKWIFDVIACTKGTNTDFIAAFVSLFKQNRARYGAYIIHISIAIMCLGIMTSSVYSTSITTESIATGDSILIDNYSLVYNGIETTVDQKTDTQVMGNRIHYVASFDIYKDGKYDGSLNAEDIYYRNKSQWVTEVGIRSNLSNDIYVSLNSWESDGSATFTVKYNPGVMWIWIGGILLIIGGLVAFSQPTKETSEEA